MKSLRQYLDIRNFWSNLNKKPLLTVETLTEEQAQKLFESLDCDLSPENLCCDGEISRAEVKKRLKFYNDCLKDLWALGFAAKARDYS